MHCSAPVEATSATDENLTVEENDYESVPQKPMPIPDGPDEIAPDTKVNFFGATGIRITSESLDKDGSRYVTGIFRGKVLAGDWVFTSRGGDDVFLAKINPKGEIAWARGIGSQRSEFDPTITFENGELRLIAFTRGQVDCGQGPLNAWNTKMFFRCAYKSDGTPVTSVSFPTGTP